MYPDNLYVLRLKCFEYDKLYRSPSVLRTIQLLKYF